MSKANRFSNPSETPFAHITEIRPVDYVTSAKHQQLADRICKVGDIDPAHVVRMDRDQGFWLVSVMVTNQDGTPKVRKGAPVTRTVKVWI